MTDITVSDDNLESKLLEAGFDLGHLSTEEKVLYVWKLYLNSEDELRNALECLENTKSQHAGEMQEIEAYVEQIKSLSDERETLTLEFEKENDQLKSQLERERCEVGEMLCQQELDEVIQSSIAEQVAFLLVERARLLDEVDLMRQNRTIKPETADLAMQTDCVELSDADTQTPTLDTSELIHKVEPLVSGFTDDEVEQNTEVDEVSCSIFDLDEGHGAATNLYIVAAAAAAEKCENCRRMNKERDEAYTKLVYSEEQVKSMARRINRFKTLLGENVVDREDELANIKDLLHTKQTELDEVRNELQQYKEGMIESAAEVHVEATAEDKEEIQRLVVELQALREEVEVIKQQTAEDLEKTILDYEEKLEAMRIQTFDQLDSANGKKLIGKNKTPEELRTQLETANDRIAKLSSELELANRNAEQLSCALDASNETVKESRNEIQDLVKKRSELMKKLSMTENELVTYQSDLEQTLATQEEELERSEELQQKIDELSSENERLTLKLNETLFSHDEARLAEVANENKELVVNYSALESQHTELLDRLAELTKEYEDVLSQLENLTKQNEELAGRYQQAVDECHKTKSEYSALQQIHEVLSDDIETLMSEKEAVTAANKQLKLEVQQLDSKNQEVCIQHQELSSLTQRVAQLAVEKEAIQKEKRELEERVTSLEEELEVLHCDIQSQDEQLRKQKSLVETVQEDLHATRELAEEYQKKLSDLEEELKKTSSWLQESRQYKELADDEIKKKQSFITELQNQLLELEQDNMKLAEGVKAAPAAIEAKDQELKALHSDKEKLQKEIEYLKGQLDLQQMELNVQYSDLESNHKALKDEKNHLLQTIEELKRHNVQLDEEHEAAQSEHREIQAQLTILQKQHRLLEDNYKEVQAENEDLTEEIEGYIREKAELIDKKERLAEDYADLQKENFDLTEELERIENRCRRLREEIEFLKNIKGNSKVAAQRKSSSGGGETSAESSMDQHMYKMEWETSLRERDSKNSELTDRIILLEKAANQLEADNRDLALKLKEALNQNDSLESNHRHEIQRLKSANTRLQEQVERLKKYGETLEKEMESLQEKVKNQSLKLQGGTEAKETEILALRTELGQLKLDHSKQVDSLEQKLFSANTEVKTLKENLESRSEELSQSQNELVKTQHALDNEKASCKQAESKKSQLEADKERLSDKVNDLNNRKAQLERENQRLTAELRSLSAVKSSDSMTSLILDTDSSKEMELAQARINTLEKQRDELNSSLSRLTVELESANESAYELSEVKLLLQSEKNEVIRLRSQLKEQATQRSYDEKRSEDLQRSLSSGKDREMQLQEQIHSLRHKLLDVEANLNQLQNTNLSLKHQVDTVESKNQSLLQKLSNQQAERETLELELLASNEKLRAHVKHYQDRKNKHKKRIQTSRMLHETEIGKLTDRLENLDRQISLLKQSLQNEEEHRRDIERKCSSLVTENRSLLSKQIDLEDEIRERNRGISLLQTKLQYIEKENIDLADLCNRLKLSPRTGSDLLETLISQQSLRSIGSPRSKDNLDLSLTFGTTTNSFESLHIEKT